MEGQGQQQQQPPPPQQQQQPPFGVPGVPGPTGRRLHIAHRRSPSELTPLVSMYTANPGSKLVDVLELSELERWCETQAS